jgi:hypothetical protein
MTAGLLLHGQAWITVSGLKPSIILQEDFLRRL